MADVIVIGAGPVGLATALHLDMYGVSTMLIEAEPQVRQHPKGNTINVRTMELFRKLGIADRVRALGLPADHPYDMAFYTRLSTFEIARGNTLSKSKRLEQRRVGPVSDQIPEPPHRANQMYLEKLLADIAATRPNIALRFGETATALTQDADGVTLTTDKGTHRVRYVIGCDGARGLVRKTLGIKYEGEEKLMDAWMAGVFTSLHLRIPDLYPKFVGRKPAWMYMAINPETRAIIISLNGADEFMMHMPGAQTDAEKIATAVKKAIGADIPVEVISHRQWNAGAYLTAASFQSGRAFLAGDSAHLYTPAGGFGLNIGIEDGANLAWKLAAVLQGWGGSRLIESYEPERKPAAVRSTSYSREIGSRRINVDVTPVAEENSPAGEAARHAISQSDFVKLNHFVKPEERDSMGVILGVRYDGSPLIVAHGAPPADSLETYAPSSVPGGRAPHVWLDDRHEAGSSLYDHFGKGFTLLRVGESGDVARLSLVMAASARKIPLTVLDIPAERARPLYDRAFYLIRPDTHIAWRGEALPADINALLNTVTGNNG